MKYRRNVVPSKTRVSKITEQQSCRLHSLGVVAEFYNLFATNTTDRRSFLSSVSYHF